MKMKWRHVFGTGLSIALMAVVIPGSGTISLASEASSSVQSSKTTGVTGEVIETETGIYYTVKKGDTLWDLSRKFSNSPYLWPDLWSGNAQIANPHRIYPGEKIQLFRREDVEMHAGPPVTTDVAPQPAAIPPPEMGQLTYSGIDRVGFIRESQVPPSGRIFKVRGIHKMISSGDIVYISRENDQNLGLGQRYTVYRTLGEVYHLGTGDKIGIQHYILGTVEITQTEPEYAIGRVVSAYARIKKDDLLMPYKRRSPKIAKTTPPPGINGEILMAEEQNKLIGDNVTAFIDKGENDGIKTGQTFSVFYQESARVHPQQENETVLKPVSFGELVVLHTEATTATVYITDANQVIIPGSRFSSPEL